MIAAAQSAMAAKRRVRCVQSVGPGSADHDVAPVRQRGHRGRRARHRVVAAREHSFDPRFVEHRRAADHEPHLEVVGGFQLHPRHLAHSAKHGDPYPARRAHHDLVAAAGVRDETTAAKFGQLRQVRRTAHDTAVAGGREARAVGTQPVFGGRPPSRHDRARGPARAVGDPHGDGAPARDEEQPPEHRELGGQPVGVGHGKHELRGEGRGDERRPDTEQPTRHPARAVELGELLGIVDVVVTTEPPRLARWRVTAVVGLRRRANRVRRAPSSRPVPVASSRSSVWPTSHPRVSGSGRAVRSHSATAASRSPPSTTTCRPAPAP